MKVLIVDDTVLYRKILGDILRDMPGIEVIGTASNGKIALAKMKQTPPDLITLDLEMPVMDGLEMLRELSGQASKPKVLMVSAYTEAGAKVTLEALALGAFDFVTKPIEGDWQVSEENLRGQLKAKLLPFITGEETSSSPPLGVGAHLNPTQPIEVIAIGISTGGPKALAQILPLLPADFPVPIVIVQHMPTMFTGVLARSLNAQCALTVYEAEAGQMIQPSHVYVAPGGKQMRLVRVGGLVKVDITDDPPENFCKPAVDYLFRSVADVYGAHALGIIMTGMGADGVEGLRSLKAKGALSLAQDEATSVVYGMPQEALKAGVVDVVLPLNEIAPEMIRVCER